MLIFKFVTLTLEDMSKIKSVVVDVDSVVYGFSSLGTYRPTVPFDVYNVSECTPCRNVKLLNAIFCRGRKSMFELVDCSCILLTMD